MFQGHFKGKGRSWAYLLESTHFTVSFQHKRYPSLVPLLENRTKQTFYATWTTPLTTQVFSSLFAPNQAWVHSSGVSHSSGWKAQLVHHKDYRSRGQKLQGALSQIWDLWTNPIKQERKSEASQFQAQPFHEAPLGLYLGDVGKSVALQQVPFLLEL